MNKTEPTGEITGKINANPNPLFFGQRCVISWETNDPAGAEIRVSTGTDDEKLVTQGGPSGHVEIPWINDSKVYEFRLAMDRAILAAGILTFNSVEVLLANYYLSLLS